MENDNNKNHEKRMREAILERTITLVLAGFGLVAALAWNDAIQSLVNVLFPLAKDTVIAKFFYAFLITAIVSIVSMRLNKIKHGKRITS